MVGLIPFWGNRLLGFLILMVDMTDNNWVGGDNSIIEIIVNGEPYRIAEGSAVIDLVTELKLAADRLAIELNLSILPRTAWDETKLKADDRLEIVHFVGGGSCPLFVSQSLDRVQAGSTNRRI
jgi:thiamine biosynthesis protein ThiS